MAIIRQSKFHQIRMAKAQATTAVLSTACLRPVDNSPVENGSRSNFDGLEYIHYNGYWVRYYEPREESLAAKKLLIDHLTQNQALTHPADDLMLRARLTNHNLIPR